MIGDTSTIQNVIRQNVGLYADTISNSDNLDGSLHGKLNYLTGELTGLYGGTYQVTANLTITANTTMTVLSGVYKDVTINDGFTLSALAPAIYLIADTITLGAGSIISASGKGASGGAAKTTAATGNIGTDAPDSIAGQGGGGGSGSTYNGGVAGANKIFNVVPVVYTVAPNGNSSAIQAIKNQQLYPQCFIGSGGGGGAAQATSSTGGAGGAGGGLVVLCCRVLTFGAGSAINAAGINGSNATGTTASGGGGGGGGTVIISTHQIIGTPSVSVAGGSGGSKVGSNVYNGGAGGAGCNIRVRW